MAGLLVSHIGQLVTPVGCAAQHGAAMSKLRVLEQAAVYAEDGIIRAVGPEKEVRGKVPAGTETIDAAGQCVLPGFIDPHTHFLCGGSRADEFVARLAGVPYLELLARGGGICATMQATRAAGAHELYQTGRARLMAMCRMGITAVEGKSGYGLDRDTELGLLRTMRRLGHDLPLTLRTTYLGAHAVPPEYAGHGDAYVAFMCQAVLPVIQAEGLADFCDAFCETGVFTVPQSAKLLRAAAARGLQLKLHADEMSSTGGAGLAVRLGAVSADHLLSVSAADIEALARSETVAVLLPATAFCMRKPFAPARTMIAAGCAVALASDFNPGSCYTYSLPLVLALAVMAMKMTLPEALTAVTLNAAAAIGAANRLGSIEPGKQADLVLLAEPDYRFLVYETGINIVGHVIQDGKLVF